MPTLPGKSGSAIDEIATGLLTDSAEYAALYRWVHSDDVPVDSRFAASLFLFEYARGDAEFADRIVRFWAGDPLPVADLRRRLKEAGAAATYRLAAARERDLAVQRFRFVPRLITAAGYRGWVVLLDEVELIGRYSLLQRAKSYAEVARWVRGDRDDPDAPIGAVLTTVDDFEAQVLVGKNDLELIPKRLRMKQTTEHELLAGLAETGMRVIERDQIRLQPPDRDELDRTYTKLKQIHADGVRVGPARRRGAGAAAVEPDAAVRAGVDQRVGPAPPRPVVPARHRRQPSGRRPLRRPSRTATTAPRQPRLTRAGRGRRRGRVGAGAHDQRDPRHPARRRPGVDHRRRRATRRCAVTRTGSRSTAATRPAGGSADALPAASDPTPRRRRSATAGLELYRWQLEALDAWRRRGGRGVVEAVTGTGKTMRRRGRRHRRARRRRAGPGARADPRARRAVDPGPGPPRPGHARASAASATVTATTSATTTSWSPSSTRPATPTCARAAPVGCSSPTSATATAPTPTASPSHAPFPRRLGLSATYARADDGHLTWLDPYFGGTCYRIGYERAIRDGIIAPFTVTLRGVELTPVERGRVRRPHRIHVGGPSSAHRLGRRRAGASRCLLRRRGPPRPRRARRGDGRRPPLPRPPSSSVAGCSPTPPPRPRRSTP